MTVSNNTYLLVQAMAAVADLGAVSIFEGPGPNPTVLPSYNIRSIWLKKTVTAQAQPALGAFFVWDGSGSSSAESSWVALTPARFLTHLAGAGVTVRDGNIDVIGSGLQGNITADGNITAETKLLARSATATPAAASAVAAISIGSAGIGIYWGTGSPDGVLSAVQGSLYIQVDGPSLWISTDATGWSEFTKEA